MKIISFLTALALFAAAGVAGVQGAQDAQAPLKEVIVTYPPSTPRSIIDEAIARISAEGGQILHDFTLFKGFLVKTTAQVLEVLETLSLEYKPNIEDDKPVSILG